MLTPNTIHRMDCIQAMRSMEAGSVDLVFADPPFNIGYEYDEYHDKKDPRAYLDWSRQWISAVQHVLKPTGTFWLAIGDDYAAELKLLSQEIGFHCRSWVLWYYTFGVNCKYKFSRSHTHLFHFVKDAKKFTFNREAILIPSARQLVYADKRAAPGRLPDDTWILRPQDLTDGFNPDEDVWYFPRVAGTFKEREGFHGCQMPEQVLGRIIKACSDPGDLVVDPFSGSATTVAVAKKLGRQFIAFDISEDYITRGLSRLAGIGAGDILDGSPEPTLSAPKTPSYSIRGAASRIQKSASQAAPFLGASTKGVLDAERGIIEAFRLSSDGYSPDRVVADPDLNSVFLDSCRKLGLPNDAWLLNKTLFRLRKAGKVTSIVPTTRRTEFSWKATDPFLFASEIAWRKTSDSSSQSLDNIICCPALALQFDEIAQQFAPGYSPLQYRWAALKLRKAERDADNRSRRLAKIRLPKLNEPTKTFVGKIERTPGLYLVANGRKQPLYAGESLNLGKLLRQQFHNGLPCRGWKNLETDFLISILPYQELEHASQNDEPHTNWLVAYQLNLVRQKRPSLNQLGAESAAV